MREEQLPIIVGVGQTVNRSGDLREARPPLEMMALAAERAAEDTQAGGALLAQLDAVVVINILSWSYPDPPAQLAARLGARPRQALYTAIGGNGPQWAVNLMAQRIARGEVQAALIAGAEAMNSLRLARREGVVLPWPESSGTPAAVGETKWGNTPVEQAHRAQMPTQIYPLFENALRAQRREDVAQQRRRLGELSAAFTRVAADNPYAWFRQARSAEELSTPSSANRMIGFPYPKLMNAIMDVDQSAAVLLTNVATARRLGIPADRWVYVRGGADANDLWFVSDRVAFHSSPAIAAAGADALAQAGVGIHQVRHLDLYSCFPCAPQIAAAMLGIPPGDPRPLTVTGGLPYAGGPGNNYSSHAIAAMTQRLRQDPGAVGLVTGVGWYLTKHSVGVYSTAPPAEPQPRGAGEELQHRLDAMKHPQCVAAAEGEAAIETYTVTHDRSGAPEVGLIVGRLDSGARFWANTPPDRDLLESMERQEMIGRRGRVRHDAASGINTFEPAG